jgi:hypothetical protein
LQERAEEEIDETENVAMFQQWALPCHEFDGLWERYRSSATSDVLFLALLP